MIDIVIPVKSNLLPVSYNELRFALRSIEKNLENVGRVIVIGECPPWLNSKEVEFIPLKEKDWYKHYTKNIHDKLMVACNTDTISDPFLYYNDDHYIMQPVNAELFPLYHKGADWGGSGQYIKTTIPATKELFPQQTIFNFDTHAPMLISKEAYKRTVGKLNWRKDFGYCIKTSYAYLSGAHVHGVAHTDLKIHVPPTSVEELEVMIGDRDVFSTSDSALKYKSLSDGSVYKNSVGLYLEKYFPNKSKYEL